MSINKKFRKAMASIAVATAVFAPTNAFAFAGIADFNISNVPSLLMRMLNNGVNFSMNGSLKSLPDDVANKMLDANSQIEILKADIENKRLARPDINACIKMTESEAMLGISSTGTQRRLEEVVKANKRKTSQTAGHGQTNDKRERASKFTCSKEDVDNKVNGCKEVSIAGGMHRSALSLSEGVIDVSISDKNGNTTPVVYNTMGIIPNGNVTLPDGRVVKYEGLEVARLFVDYQGGQVPSKIESSGVNSENEGQIYNERRDAYLGRTSAAQEAMLNIVAFNTAADPDKIKNTPAIKQVWDEYLKSEDFKAVYGGKSAAPETPSEKALLKIIVNNFFKNQVIAKNAMGGGQGSSQIQLLAINNYIQMKQLEMAESSLKMQAVSLLQQMSPIQLNDLAELRNKAETNLTGKK